MRLLLLCGITAVWTEPIKRAVQYTPHRRHTPFTQSEAQELCEAQGQTLAIISSLEEQQQLVDLLEQHTLDTSNTNQNDAIKYWIGLKRPERVNKWTWRNEGERCNPPIQFWGLNEPPGINGGDVERNCVAMEVNDVRYPDDKNWATFRCDIQQVNGYVCQTVNQGDFCGVVVDEDQDSNQGQNGTGNEDSEPDDTDNDPDSAPSTTVCLALLMLCTLLQLS